MIETVNITAVQLLDSTADSSLLEFVRCSNVVIIIKIIIRRFSH